MQLREIMKNYSHQPDGLRLVLVFGIPEPFGIYSSDFETAVFWIQVHKARDEFAFPSPQCVSEWFSLPTWKEKLQPCAI